MAPTGTTSDWKRPIEGPPAAGVQFSTDIQWVPSDASPPSKYWVWIDPGTFWTGERYVAQVLGAGSDSLETTWNEERSSPTTPPLATVPGSIASRVNDTVGI